MNENQAEFKGWAKVEVMGHQSHIGYVTTEAYGQAVLFRIDRPEEIVSEIKALNAAKKDDKCGRKVGRLSKMPQPECPAPGHGNLFGRLHGQGTTEVGMSGEHHTIDLRDLGALISPGEAIAKIEKYRNALERIRDLPKQTAIGSSNDAANWAVEIAREARQMIQPLALGITLGWGAPLYFGLDFGPVMVYVDGWR